MQLAEHKAAKATSRRQTHCPVQEPLTVRHAEAQRLLGVGKSKYWQLVKEGHIETVRIGRGSLARYASLKRLTGYSNDT